MTDEERLAHEAAVAAALDGPQIAGEPPARTSRMVVLAFIVAVGLLGIVAATPAGDALGSLIGGSAGCGEPGP